MDAERFRKIRSLFDAALDHEVNSREAFLREACREDTEALDEVLQLLSVHTSGSSFLDENGPCAPGRRFGPYEILERLGAGGMGEVYRAKDSRLGREVAIKLLPAQFSNNANRNQRLRREAQALAAFNHPHIAQVYDLHEIGATLCLVMELVHGETLAERLKRGAVPVAAACKIALEIAEALEETHERGVLHRDLKPANIKVTPEGQIKVLDFGLARIASPEIPGDRGQESPVRIDETEPGAILGTSAYMSPEQASGKTVDARTDIWAFGCVFFEMLTGKPVFDGSTDAELQAEVLKAEPDWTLLPAATPLAIVVLLKHCMAKDPKRRLRHIGDARLQIEDALADSSSTAAVVDAHLRLRIRRWRMAAAVLLIASAAVAAYFLRTAPVAPQVSLQFETPAGASLVSHSISPDGGKIVFQVTQDGKSQLYLRWLATSEAEALSGAESEGPDEMLPCWKPDSRSVAFFSNGQLKRIDLDGGLVRTLAAATTGGCAWSRTGAILFAPTLTSPLYRISEDGGPSAEATRLGPHGGHAFPKFHSDGRHFLFLAYGSAEVQGVHLATLGSTEEPRRLFDADSAPVFAPPDRILYAQEGALVWRRLDPASWDAVGDPVRVAPEVFEDPVSLLGAFSASETRAITYRPNVGTRQFAWFDRQGNRLTNLGEPDSYQPAELRLSPDGNTLLLTRSIGRAPNVWRMDSVLGILDRFTWGQDGDTTPVWSPDGRRILYRTAPDGFYDLYERHTDGSTDRKLVYSSYEDKGALDWSADGRYVLYWSENKSTGRDLWALRLEGDERPLIVEQTPFNESEGRFSTDGRFVVYQSDETGRNEIYIKPFPVSGLKRRISTNGGAAPQWRKDGRELFYIAPDNSLMHVSVLQGGSGIVTGAPELLFKLPQQSTFVPAANGQRFLVNTVMRAPSPITVIVNWKR
jgi:serine/threonine protein kinase